MKEFELTNVLTKSLHSELQGNPILLSVEGKELDVAVDGKLISCFYPFYWDLFSDKAIRLKVVPSMKGLVKRVTENTCFLFDLTTELIFQVCLKINFDTNNKSGFFAPTSVFFSKTNFDVL